MATKKKPVLLPGIVYKMCVHGALIVGSYAKFLAGEKIKPHDYDLLVPPEHWQTCAMLIPRDAKLNSFGGWRFIDPQTKMEVDIWPSTLEKYLSECRTRHGGNVCAVDFINNRLYTSSCIPIG